MRGDLGRHALAGGVVVDTVPASSQHRRGSSAHVPVRAQRRSDGCRHGEVAMELVHEMTYHAMLRAPLAIGPARSVTGCSSKRSKANSTARGSAAASSAAAATGSWWGRTGSGGSTCTRPDRDRRRRARLPALPRRPRDERRDPGGNGECGTQPSSLTSTSGQPRFSKPATRSLRVGQPDGVRRRRQALSRLSLSNTGSIESRDPVFRAPPRLRPHDEGVPMAGNIRRSGARVRTPLPADVECRPRPARLPRAADGAWPRVTERRSRSPPDLGLSRDRPRRAGERARRLAPRCW